MIFNQFHNSKSLFIASEKTIAFSVGAPQCAQDKPIIFYYNICL